METSHILQILRLEVIEAVMACQDDGLLDLVYKLLMDSLEG